LRADASARAERPASKTAFDIEIRNKSLSLLCSKGENLRRKAKALRKAVLRRANRVVAVFATRKPQGL
jgi:hypothetical protein